MQSVVINKLLIVFVVWSSFFSFLYMNLFIFFLFLMSSGLLIYKERVYVWHIIYEYKNSVSILFIYLIIFSLPFIVFSNYSTIVYYVLTLWSIFLAIIFLKDRNIVYFYFGIKYLLLVFMITILSYLYLTQGLYLPQFRLDYMIGNNVSGNGPTSFLNILLGVYTALRMKLKDKSSIIISLICLYIVIEGYGRASIIFVLLIILINLIFIFFKLKKVWQLFFIVCFSLVFILLLPAMYELLLTTNFHQGLNSTRMVIAKEYMNNMNSFSLFFGVPYEGTSIANIYYNNPHIAYIRTHHIFGLSYFFGLAYLLYKKIVYVMYNSTLVNWMILFIIFNILIRAISEPLLFPTLFDSFFLVVLFLITKKLKKEDI